MQESGKKLLLLPMIRHAANCRGHIALIQKWYGIKDIARSIFSMVNSYAANMNYMR
jgi:hypothetical protein